MIKTCSLCDMDYEPVATGVVHNGIHGEGTTDELFLRMLERSLGVEPGSMGFIDGGAVVDPETVQRAVDGNAGFDSPPPPPHRHTCSICEPRVPPRT